MPVRRAHEIDPHYWDTMQPSLSQESFASPRPLHDYEPLLDWDVQSQPESNVMAQDSNHDHSYCMPDPDIMPDLVDTYSAPMFNAPYNFMSQGDYPSMTKPQEMFEPEAKE